MDLDVISKGTRGTKNDSLFSGLIDCAVALHHRSGGYRSGLCCHI